MRAAVLRSKALMIADIPDPVPGPGEVLVKTLACGICGSDVHFLKNPQRFVDLANGNCGVFDMDLTQDIVLGHEFGAEVMEYGPGTTRKLQRGTRVTSVPVLMTAKGPQAVGYSNVAPGGYGEYMKLTEAMLLELPGGMSPEAAALTEPMAVGFHAVERTRLEAHEAPLVIGCGPVGLAVIAALRLKGQHPIIAADFSQRRRELAVLMGADVVVDPLVDSPYKTWEQYAAYSNPQEAPPLPPWASGPALRPAVVFECVGLPGLINQVMFAAPLGARITVVGVCMEQDHFEPYVGVVKEQTLTFSMAYTAEEFVTVMRHIADGSIPVEPLITKKVGLNEITHAVAELGSPGMHAKILVEPWR